MMRAALLTQGTAQTLPGQVGEERGELVAPECHQAPQTLWLEKKRKKKREIVAFIFHREVTAGTSNPWMSF